MKIIKQGKIPTSVKRFECMNCGCIFEAEKGEYRIEEGQYKSTEYFAVCPCCGKDGYKREIIMR